MSEMDQADKQAEEFYSPFNTVIKIPCEHDPKYNAVQCFECGPKAIAAALRAKDEEIAQLDRHSEGVEREIAKLKAERAQLVVDYCQARDELDAAIRDVKYFRAQNEQLETCAYQNNEINDHQRSEIEAIKAELEAVRAENQRWKEIQAEEVGENCRIADRIGLTDAIKAGKSYADAEIELFERLTRERDEARQQAAEAAERQEKFAEDVIDLFLEWRDQHGCNEKDAKLRTLTEVAESILAAQASPEQGRRVKP